MARHRRHAVHHRGWHQPSWPSDHKGNQFSYSDFPAWSCSCGTADNYGWRDRCRGCGGRAPTTAQGRPRNAWHYNEDKEAKQTLQEELRKAKAKIAKLEAGEAVPAPTPTPADATPDQEAQKLDQEVKELEDELAKLRPLRFPGSDKAVADLERHIAYKRSLAHEAWPMERQKLRLEKRAKCAMDDLQMAQQKVQATRSTLEEMHTKLQEQLQALANKKQKAEEQHKELLAFLEQAAPCTEATTQEQQQGSAANNMQVDEVAEMDVHTAVDGMCDELLGNAINPDHDKRTEASKRMVQLVEARAQQLAKRMRGGQGQSAAASSSAAQLVAAPRAGEIAAKTEQEARQAGERQAAA